MKALVTGCAGFIGHHLVQKLLTEGWEVVGVDNMLTGDLARVAEINKSPGNSRFFFREMSVQEYLDYLDEKVKVVPFDMVFHLAALPRVPVSFDRPRESFDNNFLSTVAALEIARKYGYGFVYSSSSSVYGSQTEFPFRENMFTHPESPYALSKLIGEDLCEQYFSAFNVPSVSLRYFNVYGPGMTKGGYATAIRTFLDAKKNNNPLPITGDGKQERDFTHVYDVVNANYLAALAILKTGVDEEYHARIKGPYNIGAGVPRSVLSVAEAIGGGVVHIEARREPKKTHADYSRAKQNFGWEPTQDFNERIKELLTTEL